MSKTRKVLSLVLALAMVFATLAVTASAANYYEDEESAAEYTQTWALGEPVDNGDGTFSVDVSLTTNYATGPIQFVITNSDNTVAVLSSAVTVGSAIPAAYKATASASNKTGKVIIVPSTAGVQTLTAQAIDGVIATLTYTYSGSGSATIAIANNSKSETNPAGTLIASRMSDGNIVTGDPISGQTVTDTGVERTIGTAAAPADLAVKAAYADSGIIIDTAKTFGGEYDGVVYGFTLPGNGATKVTQSFYETYLEATNGGSITVVATPYVKRPVSYGTGSTIQVYNDGETEPSKTYLLVLFGDVDGNGQINISDVTKSVDELDVAGTLELPQVMAINVKPQARGTDAAKAAALYTVAITDITEIASIVDTPVDIQVSMAEAHKTYSATNYQ